MSKCSFCDFTINIPFYTESLHYNTCLNRKLCIDAEGNIKNCPNMQQSYGNISNTKLEDVVNNIDFQQCWQIKKDDVDVCKDCEFRYMCTDCRAFLKIPQNPFSQPDKCGYNPYIAKWDGQESFVSVDKCGNYNEKGKFIPDHKKIAELNTKIWGEK